jgi:hypothetical protein
MKIYDSGVGVRIAHEPPKNLDDLLMQIFWKDPKLVPITRKFLNHIREWGRSESPYHVDEWDNYCTREGLSQSSYHNILKRLKRAGMIKKVYNKNLGKHELYLTDRFSISLYGMAEVWNSYLGL